MLDPRAPPRCLCTWVVIFDHTCALETHLHCLQEFQLNNKPYIRFARVGMIHKLWLDPLCQACPIICEDHLVYRRLRHHLCIFILYICHIHMTLNAYNYKSQVFMGHLSWNLCRRQHQQQWLIYYIALIICTRPSKCSPGYILYKGWGLSSDII